jgi:glycerol-3-phosphate acyltransferase PlsX
MKIGIDILGGDFAPDVNLAGIALALNELPENVVITCIGDENQIKQSLIEYNIPDNKVEIVHAPDVITMHDHPTRAIPQKPNSSIAVGFDLLMKNEIDAFASTGNTLPGVIRPCITSTLPAIDGSKTILLDVGSNADCKVDVLYQFAVLGSLYSKSVYGVENPKVALLNIGEEESKGNLLTIAAHGMLAKSDEINFVGNIEGRDLFMGKADVIVCDGYTGNIVLKEAEGIYTLMRKRGIRDEYFDRFNYENYGGTPILGVKGNVIIGHGISNDIAVKNMILHSYEVANSQLSEKLNQAFNS